MPGLSNRAPGQPRLCLIGTDGARFLLGNDGGAYYNGNRGAGGSWLAIPGGMNIGQFYAGQFGPDMTRAPQYMFGGLQTTAI